MPPQPRTERLLFLIGRSFWGWGVKWWPDLGIGNEVPWHKPGPALQKSLPLTWLESPPLDQASGAHPDSGMDSYQSCGTKKSRLLLKG